MSLYLLDTDHFSHYCQGTPRVVKQVLARLTHRLAISVITVEESLGGWQRSLSQAGRDRLRKANVYFRMARTAESIAGWTVIPFSIAAMDRYDVLRGLRLNVGGDDLRIAATALEAGATVVTANVRDFSRVSGLQIEDWTS